MVERPCLLQANSFVFFEISEISHAIIFKFMFY
jgi:hypothetical protein